VTGGGAKPIASGDGSKPSGKIQLAGLHIVATPIGNLRDITLRAIDTLSQVDFIACEDTRVTARLLSAHDIRTSMTAYHEHNAARVLPGMIKRLENGETMALVSDAGTPLISDPGYRLVRAAQDAGIPVTTEPGPSSPLAALVLSGLPSDRFLFAGFLPNKQAARKRILAEFANINATLVFLESTRRLAASLSDMAVVLGAREAAVARELTKLHEEIRRGDLAELADHYRDAGPPKGEAVVVVGPPDQDAALVSAEELDDLLIKALNTMSVRDAASTVAAASGRTRRDIYARALELSAGE
jgi:16S rRNA (cytidine1402-2'-O)-methyltransferase